MTVQEQYLKEQEASGLKVGDKVKVLFKVSDRARGWRNSWVPEMDEAIGKIFTIDNFHGAVGIYLKECFHLFPFFCLEKVEDAKDAKDDYDSLIDSLEICSGLKDVIRKIVNKPHEEIGGKK